MKSGLKTRTGLCVARVTLWLGLGVWLLAGTPRGYAVDLDEAHDRFEAGDYEGCLALLKTNTAVYRSEQTELLHSQALLATGRYPEAYRLMTNALARDSRSVRLRWQAREVFLGVGKTAEASNVVEEIVRTVAAQPRAYRDGPSLVVFGQAVLLRGADPKRVLDNLFETARRDDPRRKEIYLAMGRLALDKHDYALAAKRFEEGLKLYPEDPELNFGLARAYVPSEPELTRACLNAVLDRNTNHAGALLLIADRAIDAEDFEQADQVLERVLRVNPWHPEAWAYRAVLAHLRHQMEQEKEARGNALKYWETNPRVDHLIGQKLSQNYRFAEGSAYQRRALEFDAGYLPAKAQLAQDLLRLGQEKEGWKLAEEVYQNDQYDVEAFNLVTLRETMKKFVVLTNADFIVRMSAHEASLYGTRVLELLGRAKARLTAEYGIELSQPTAIEIFPEQKDFAVRTFGMPGNPGYLGVCFGPLVTANSPASHRNVNWEAVLWHEFTHVVTLHATKNKMPRWLSEGISVYEELQANPAWGQRMNPEYREMILEGELTPVSELSGAFLAPRTPLHLQFAYYESYLVVDFIVQRYGREALKRILHDIGNGAPINQAIEKHTAKMESIDTAFAEFAKERAQALAPTLDWEKPPTQQASGLAAVLSGGNSAENWWDLRTNNFYVLSRKSEELIAGGKFEEAKPLLERLIKAYPGYIGEDSPYRLLARAHRELGETELEKRVLEKFAAEDATATDVYLRLMELDTTAGKWPAVLENANRYLAVNPLVPAPYEHLVRAAEATEALEPAIAGYRALLQLDPIDPAGLHYKLARHLHRKGDPEARKHVLQALEEAPRYRAALELLLEMNPQSTRVRDKEKLLASP